MLAGAEHSCAMSYLKKGIPLIVQGTHYADSKALKLPGGARVRRVQAGTSVGCVGAEYGPDTNQ
jgi:hypothetical protein